MSATKNRLFAKYGHECEITSSWEDLYMFQGSSNILTQIKRAWIRCRMASELNNRGNMFLKSQKALEMEHRRQIHHLHIVHPFSVFRKYWETFMVFVFATVFIIIPLDLASFECPIQGHLNDNKLWKWIRLVFDLFCLGDVVTNFFTGYCDVVNKHVVMEPRKIAFRYAVTYFIPDLLSSIPTHTDLFINLGSGQKGTSHGIAKTFFQYTSCFKITRIITFHRYCKRLSEAYNINYAAYRITVSLFLFIIYFHVVTCLNVAFVGMSLQAVRKARADNLGSAKLIDRNMTVTFFRIYTRMFFHSTHMVLTSKFTFDKWRADMRCKRICVIIIWSMSKLIFFYVVSQLIHVVTTVKSSKSKYREMVRQLREYMRYKQLPENLQKRLISYYEFRFQKSYFRESEILNTISGQLRQEIVMHSCRKLVENVEFFKNLPLPLIIRIVSALVTDIYMVNDVIIKVNTLPTCMYFIASGCVAVYTKGGQEVCHLEDGNFFGEVGLVHYHRLRSASIVAVETCELYRLERQDFIKAILPYPDLMEKIQKIAMGRLEQSEFVEERSAKQRQEFKNTMLDKFSRLTD